MALARDEAVAGGGAADACRAVSIHLEIEREKVRNVRCEFAVSISVASWSRTKPIRIIFLTGKVH